jgi:hypothetical protein
MARFTSIQTNFSTGELDPLLRARVDLEAYNNAVEEATNVVVQPQGGMRRRPGLKYLLSLPNAGSESAANGVRLVPFEFSTSDSYMLCFTHNRMHVFRNGAQVLDINGGSLDYLDTSSVGLTGARLGIINWTQSADTLIVVHPDINPVKIVRGATNADWTASTITFDAIPKYAFTASFSNPAGTLTPSAVSGKITLTASTGTPFSAGSVGQYVNATPQGRAKIVKYTSATVVDAITEFPFFNTSAIASGSWEYESGYEAVWSAGRGYPRSVIFHEGRLFFGGSKTRPSTVWGSKVGLFFDFEPTEGLDDDAVEATLDTNTFNAIVDIQSGRDLQVFTTGGEFYVPQLGLDPITPTNFFVKASTKNGAKEGIKTQQLESGSLFIQRQGKSLNEFLYTDAQATYITSKISLLAGHLLKTPTRMVLRRSVATDENDLLLIVNGADGSIAAFSLLRAQNVIAPSEFTTSGEFVDVGVDLTTIYTVVKRTVSSSTVYYVEIFDDNFQTDSAVSGGAAASASLSHLVGKTVDIVLDGAVQAQQTVPGGGTVTFSRSSTTSYQVGLDYNVQIKTMPVDLKLQSGTRIGFRKRILEVNLLVKDTQSMSVNGIEVPFRALGASILDDAIVPFTGTKTVSGILGYTQDGQITIQQTDPLKMILLGMEYKISVYPGT